MNENNNSIGTNTSSENHWENYPKWWDVLSSPLRPSPEDVDFLKLNVLPRLQVTSSAIKKVVLLGVTPEIATIPWSENTELLAVDSSHHMIRTVWDQTNVSGGKAVCGDWRQLPLPDCSCDLVLGDGCFTLLDYPHGYRLVLQEVLRVLKPEGLLAMRFFLRPSQSEDVKTIFEQLRAKSIGNFHVFKWRLAMALQQSVEEGVLVSNIWKSWKQEVQNSKKLLQNLDWPVEVLTTINIYKSSSNIYSFPTLMEVRQIFSADFIEEACYFPDYELGERCPTMLLRSKKSMK